MTKYLAAITCVLVLSGCGGASLSELSSHHVWERAICEADGAEEAQVRRGIEEDQQLAIALQAVPVTSIEALGPEGAANPIDDLVLVRQRAARNEVPVESFEVRTQLVLDGARAADTELTFQELLRRTGETAPAPRRVTTGSRTIGAGEFLLRLGLGVMTVGLSELFIRSSGSGGSRTYTEVPSASELHAAAPHASSIGGAVADAEARESDRLHVWRRPPVGSRRAIAIDLRYGGLDRERERCELRERLVIPLSDDGPLEDAIEARFGHREHTLAELRAMQR